MFYYFAEFSGDLIDIKRPVLNEEYETIQPYVTLLSQMLVDRNRIDSITFSHNSFMETMEKFSTQNQYEVAKEIQ